MQGDGGWEEEGHAAISVVCGEGQQEMLQCADQHRRRQGCAMDECRQAESANVDDEHWRRICCLRVPLCDRARRGMRRGMRRSAETELEQQFEGMCVAGHVLAVAAHQHHRPEFAQV